MQFRLILWAFFLPILAVANERPNLAAAVESLPISAGEQKADEDLRYFQNTFEFEPPSFTDIDPGSEPNFHKILRRRIRKRLSKTHVIWVTPEVKFGVLFTGPSTYHEGERDRVPPASTNKIFTSALVLKELGGDYTYETHLTWVKSQTSDEAGYLTFVGAGDPSLGTSDLPKLAEEFAAGIVASGVRKIYGPLRFTATDPRWSLRTVPEGWKSTDLGTVDGFIPDALGTLITSKVRAALLRGFANKGIHWIPNAAVPFLEDSKDARGVSHFSRPLRELIRPFVLNSINYKGEAFLRKVGELRGARSAPNLHVAGLAVLREFVSEMLGPNAVDENVILNDGSGLSRTSRVTASVMIDFLNGVKNQPYFQDFLAALPTAGRTGTLEHRMAGTTAVDRVHAKTGTLDGYYQLAGYLAETTRAGIEYHPFAILTNTKTASAGYCRSVQDSAVVSLTDWMLSRNSLNP